MKKSRERCPSFHWQYRCQKDADHVGECRTVGDDCTVYTWMTPGVASDPKRDWLISIPTIHDLVAADKITAAQGADLIMMRWEVIEARRKSIWYRVTRFIFGAP